MKNNLTIPEQPILDALNLCKTLLLEIFHEKKSGEAQAGKLTEQFNALNDLLINNQQDQFSLEFYADIGEMAQIISPLRLEQAQWLSENNLAIILNTFIGLACFKIYNHPMLAPKTAEELIEKPELAWPTPQLSEQEILQNLYKMRDYVEKTSELANMSTQRAIEVDALLAEELEKLALISEKKSAEFIDNLTEKSQVVALIHAAAALLADRAAQAYMDFENMLNTASTFLPSIDKDQ
jgi:hypothetical protein